MTTDSADPSQSNTSIPSPAGANSDGTTNMTVLGNPQLFALLMSAIDDRVAARTRERNESLRNWLIGVLTVAIIAVTTAGGFALDYFSERAVKNAVATSLGVEVEREVRPAAELAVESKLGATVEEAVEDAVQRVVEPAIGRAVDAARFDSAVAALNFRVLNLDNSEGFSHDEANHIIREIKSLYSSSDVGDKEKLVFAVETAAENFAAASRPDFVNRLEEAAPDVLQVSTAVTSAMVQTEGFSLLSDAGSPRSWVDPDGILRDTYESYRRYANRAKVSGYPELYLIYELLLGYVARVNPNIIHNLIDDAENLNDEDAQHFRSLMSSLASGTVIRTDDARSKRASSSARNFLCEYGTRGMLLPAVVSNLELKLQC